MTQRFICPILSSLKQLTWNLFVIHRYENFYLNSQIFFRYSLLQGDKLFQCSFQQLNIYL